MLEEEYKYNERDLLGKFTEDGDLEREYRDFWHFVIEKADITNGCIFVMHEEWAEGAEGWQVEILQRYLHHFGDGENGNRHIEFWVAW